MKLIMFDKSTARTADSSEATIRFHQSGVILLSKAFIEKAKLKPGEKVFVAQDEESPDDWYLVAKDDNGFKLREYKGNNGLAFNNAYIAKSIIKFMEVNTSSIRFKLATEPAEIKDKDYKGGGKMYAILISTAKFQELEEQE